MRKKSGELGICLDIRRLNAQTVKSSYPLPYVEDFLEPLGGNTLYSQLDLGSGYWQIPVAERSRDLTGFRTEEGQFRFKRMPFGLCNAPGSFQKLMNAVFAGLPGINLQIFLDDICIASKS